MQSQITRDGAPTSIGPRWGIWAAAGCLCVEIYRSTHFNSDGPTHRVGRKRWSIVFFFRETRASLRKCEHSKLQVILLGCSKGKERIKIGHIQLISSTSTSCQMIIDQFAWTWYVIEHPQLRLISCGIFYQTERLCCGINRGKYKSVDYISVGVVRACLSHERRAPTTRGRRMIQVHVRFYLAGNRGTRCAPPVGVGFECWLQERTTRPVMLLHSGWQRWWDVLMFFMKKKRGTFRCEAVKYQLLSSLEY